MSVTELKLRDYQLRGVAKAGELWLAGLRRFALQLPTGAGKTVVGARFISGAIAKGHRAVFLSHRREIVGQTYWKLVDDGVPQSELGVLMGDGNITDRTTGRPMRAVNPSAACIIASIDTWRARPQKPPAQVVFIDECHHCAAKTWRAVMDYYVERGAVVIGLTATPCRADGAGLDDLFEHLHCIETMSNLIAAGYLAQAKVFVGKTPDGLRDVKVRAGDYEVDELSRVMRKRELIGDIVAQWQKRAEDRTTVVFATDVLHSLDIVRRFREAGVAAEHLDGQTPKEERDAILSRLSHGTTRVVSNVGVLTEGWDEPKVKCVVLARPTKSLALYLQCVGRGLRPWNDVVPIVLDHSDTARRFGPPHIDRTWTLEGRRRKPDEADPDEAEGAKYPICEKCSYQMPPGMRVCPECGFEKPVLRVVEVDGDLEELKWGGAPPTAPTVARPALSFDERHAADLRRLINREIGLIATTVCREYLTDVGGPPDREAVVSTLNRLIYRRLGKSRNAANALELQPQLDWLRATTSASGAYTPSEEAAWTLRLKRREPSPAKPATTSADAPPTPRTASDSAPRAAASASRSDATKPAAVQYSLFGGNPQVVLPKEPKPTPAPQSAKPAPAPAPAPPRVSPRVESAIARAIDKAREKWRREHPEEQDDFDF